MSRPTPPSLSTLSTLACGRRARVSALALAEREASWLRAVGLGEGVEVTELRRAPFGGPLHLRTGAGAELAVDLALARHVEVTEA
jgi:ferrous iron transport protein A